MKFDLSNTAREVIALAEKNKITPEEAEKLLQQSQICLEAGTEIKTSYTLQVAFISCLNAGGRIFKGGVICSIPNDVPNLTNFAGETFNEAIQFFYSKACENKKPEGCFPKILFGKHPSADNEIELICSGWQGGINIYNSDINILNDNETNVCLGACLASSYALFWAFNYAFAMTKEQEDSFGYSLWANYSEHDWYNSCHNGPSDFTFPSKIWTVGLGHLGQAYLWVLSNSKNVTGCEVLLQDYDVLGYENLGAQLLSFESQIQEYKTRICAEFLKMVGIRSKIIEKPFNTFDQADITLSSFKIVLTGLDNIEARRCINPDSFNICLDGATNGKLINFDSFTFRNLKLLKKRPEEIWQKDDFEENVFHENLYKMVEEKGGCGILTNVGISTPFVGLFGASIIVSELAKNLLDENQVSIFSGKMRSVDSYSTVVCNSSVKIC